MAKQLFLQKKVKQYKVSPPKTKSTGHRAFCFTKSLLVPLGFLAKKKDELFVRLYINGTPKGNTRICIVEDNLLVSTYNIWLTYILLVDLQGKSSNLKSIKA